jgi:hypothetical protein
VRKAALSPEWGEIFITELDSLQQQEIGSWKDQITAIQSKIAGLDDKLQRLVNAYIDGDVPVTEYRQAKKRLIETKQNNAEKLSAMQKIPKQPFEPAKRFIRGSVEARKIADSDDIPLIRNFLQVNCSNLTIRNGTINACYRGAWEIVAGQGPLGNPLAAASPVNAFISNSLRAVVPERSLRDGARTMIDGVRGFFKDNPAWV